MRLPGAALTAALTLLAPIARADDPVIVLVGDAASPVTVRVRTELEALGHRVVVVATPEAQGRVTLSLGADRLAATIAMGARTPVDVVTLTTERDAEALFALRVGEAVRAGLLAPPPPPPPPPPEPNFGVSFGARALVSPGGFGPIVAPVANLRWAQRLYVALSLAPFSWGGAAAGPSTLRVFTASLGVGLALPVARSLRVDVGGRVDYFALAHAQDGRPDTERRDGVVAASAAASARWRVNSFFALRAEASVGATFAAVILVLRDGSVAEWGRPLVGAEIGAEFLF